MASHVDFAQGTNTGSGTSTCPRCGLNLIDATGLGWCRGCGYCRSLEDERAQELLQQAQTSRPAVSMAGLAGNVPLWFWVLLGGIAASVGASFAIGRLLPTGNTFARALWTTLQVGLGLLAIFACQLMALVQVAADDEKLGFKDALVPTRLWSVVCKRLPATASYLWGATWALALVVSAVVFIGGLGHWYSYLPGAKKDQQTKRQR